MKKLAFFIVLILLISTLTGLFFVDIQQVRAGTTTVDTTSDWTNMMASSDHITISDGSLTLNSATQGNWTSNWYEWSGATQINTTISTDLFDRLNRTILMDGSEDPYQGNPSYDWYGRPTIYIDQTNTSRWYMPFRIGEEHVNDNDAVLIFTSNDEGKTWGGINEYYNGSYIYSSPNISTLDSTYEGEPFIVQCPNGSLVLQLWNGLYSGQWKQYRSEDNGFTWNYESHNPVVNFPSGGGLSDNFKAGQAYIINPYDTNELLTVIETCTNSPIDFVVFANSTDNATSWHYISRIGGDWVFEPALEFVGDNTLVSILRPRTNNLDSCYLSISTDMGETWSSRVDIDNEVGWWQRARIFTESNRLFDPYQDDSIWTNKSYINGEGRLWGVGVDERVVGGKNRSFAAYYSDEKGNQSTWNGPFGLYTNPPSYTYPPPSSTTRDSGYGDIKRRSDGSFCAVSYYGSDRYTADLIQVDFGGERAFIRIEVDTNADLVADETRIFEVYNNTFNNNLSGMSAGNVRFTVHLQNNDTLDTPVFDSFDFDGDLGNENSGSAVISSINNQGNNSAIQEPYRYFNWTKVSGATNYSIGVGNSTDGINATDIFLQLDNITISNGWCSNSWLNTSDSASSYAYNYWEEGNYCIFYLPYCYNITEYKYHYYQVRAYTT